MVFDKCRLSYYRFSIAIAFTASIKDLNQHFANGGTFSIEKNMVLSVFLSKTRIVQKLQKLQQKIMRFAFETHLSPGIQLHFF